MRTAVPVSSVQVPPDPAITSAIGRPSGGLPNPVLTSRRSAAGLTRVMRA